MNTNDPIHHSTHGPEKCALLGCTMCLPPSQNRPSPFKTVLFVVLIYLAIALLSVVNPWGVFGFQ
jgi:hypothetical protein